MTTGSTRWPAAAADREHLSKGDVEYGGKDARR